MTDERNPTRGILSITFVFLRFSLFLSACGYARDKGVARFALARNAETQSTALPIVIYTPGGISFCFCLIIHIIESRNLGSFYLLNAIVTTNQPSSICISPVNPDKSNTFFTMDRPRPFPVWPVLAEFPFFIGSHSSDGSQHFLRSHILYLCSQVPLCICPQPVQ